MSTRFCDLETPHQKAVRESKNFSDHCHTMETLVEDLSKVLCKATEVAKIYTSCMISHRGDDATIESLYHTEALLNPIFRKLETYMTGMQESQTLYLTSDTGTMMADQSLKELTTAVHGLKEHADTLKQALDAVISLGRSAPDKYNSLGCHSRRIHSFITVEMPDSCERARAFMDGYDMIIESDWSEGRRIS
jgi:hypothetical protein